MIAASKIACFRRAPARARVPLQREVDHHDGVLLDDADQHDHADKGVERQRQADQIQRQQRAHRRRRQARQDGQRVDEAFIQNAQDDVDHDDRHEQQHAHIRGGLLEGRGRALEAALNRSGMPICWLHLAGCPSPHR